MGIFKDLTGCTFERLTVIKRLENNKYGKARWLCKCDCDGNEKGYIGSQLINGNTKSCGCHARKRASEANKKYNTYDLSGEYGVGWTSNTNKEFYFDLEDYDLIKDHCWSENRGYIDTKVNNISLRMHRLIMNAKDTEKVDHIYHKKYDNRKSELRFCTISQNGCNMLTPSDNTSGVKGVRWHKRNCAWEAYIRINKKQINLGYFSTLEDATKVRKEAEIKYHGEYRLQTV